MRNNDQCELQQLSQRLTGARGWIPLRGQPDPRDADRRPVALHRARQRRSACSAAAASPRCAKVQHVRRHRLRSTAASTRIDRPAPGSRFPRRYSPASCCGQCVSRVPHRRADRARAIPTRSTPRSPTRPSMCVVQPRPGRPRRAGRGIRHAHGHAPSPARWPAALRRLGFDKVFDTDFAADLTIMEEANELLGPHQERRRAADDHLLLARLDQVLPSTTIRTSWPNLSSCKSPHEMQGAIIKQLLCREDRHRSQGHRSSSRSCPAPPRSSRSRAPELGTRRPGGCGRRASPPASWRG